MTNEELIDALRKCGKASADRCWNCDYYDREPWCESALANDAADALEAADKRIAELESQKPKRGDWIEKWRFKTDGTPFHKIGDMECSVCHGDMLGRYYSKYCPHCGALLRGEHDGET